MKQLKLVEYNVPLVDGVLEVPRGTLWLRTVRLEAHDNTQLILSALVEQEDDFILSKENVTFLVRPSWGTLSQTALGQDPHFLGAVCPESSYQLYVFTNGVVL